MAREVTPEMRASMQRGGAWLRRVRQEAGYDSGSAFARDLGIKQVRLNSYERGMYQVEAEVARRVADVLGLSEVEVWRGLELPMPREVVSDEAAIEWARTRYPGEIERIIAQATGRPVPAPPPAESDSGRSGARTGPRPVTRADDDGLTASQG